MKEQPTLETDRLVLRPLLLQDDLFVRELANNPKTNSMNIWSLHGYGRQMARRWIGFIEDRGAVAGPAADVQDPRWLWQERGGYGRGLRRRKNC